jgi:hypothetical protein
MAVMSVSDRIIYQAIANVVAEKARPLLSVVSNRQSFANILCEKDLKPFFLPWKDQYKLFQKKFTELYEEGNHWLVETDLAAFYETLDHELLVSYLRQQEFVDDQVAYRLTKYLSVWAAVSKDIKANRGLPQGCIASDLFSNIFLYQLDKEMSCGECYYVRYVDDIRLLSSSVDFARKGLIKVDRKLKRLGLLIQTNKTTIRKVENLEDEIDKLAYQLSEIEDRLEHLNEIWLSLGIDPLNEAKINQIALNGEVALDETVFESLVEEDKEIQNSLLDLFWDAKKSLDEKTDEFAERHLRFCLYRLKGNQEVAYSVLDYLNDRPWLSDVICEYLCRCEFDNKIIESLKAFIYSHEVYDNAVSSVIEMLVKKSISLRDFHGRFRGLIIENCRDWPLLCSIIKALGQSTDNLSVLLEVLLSKSYTPLVKRESLIQIVGLASSKEETYYALSKSIFDHSPLIIDVVLYLIYVEHGLTLKIFMGDKDVVSDYCLTMAQGYDDSLPYRKQCYIRHQLQKRYYCEIDDELDLHSVFSSYYKRASQFLWDSERSFLTNPSRYVSQLDLFHEELLYPLIVDVAGLSDSYENLSKIAFPDRLRIIQKQVPELSTFASAGLQCHTLRSKSTEAHTRIHKCLDPTVPVNAKQRDNLKKTLCAAYQELMSYLIVFK